MVLDGKRPIPGSRSLTTLPLAREAHRSAYESDGDEEEVPGAEGKVAEEVPGDVEDSGDDEC